MTPAETTAETTADPSSAAPSATDPLASAVVVHWHDEDGLARLLDAWPVGPRWELLVVDNSRSAGELLAGHEATARRLDPGANLGFAGGVNHGWRAARGDWILVLNPDARPEPGALETLLAAIERHPKAAGLVPALFDEQETGGASQHRWQLQRLPRPLSLLGRTLFLARDSGPAEPPPPGARIEQPAGAALMLRSAVLEEIGGLDPAFYPAWFEDVDLAKRLHAAGKSLIYVPTARFRHGGGGSLTPLGYGTYLWVHHRNLARYLARHHGRGWALAARVTLLLGVMARALALPLRRPRHARGWRDAAAGLSDLALGALSGFRRPRSLVERFAPPAETTDDAGGEG